MLICSNPQFNKCRSKNITSFLLNTIITSTLTFERELSFSVSGSGSLILALDSYRTHRLLDVLVQYAQHGLISGTARPSQDVQTTTRHRLVSLQSSIQAIHIIWKPAMVIASIWVLKGWVLLLGSLQDRGRWNFGAESFVLALNLPNWRTV